MDLLNVKQADMMRSCRWSRATASQLYNRRQDYNPTLVKQAAAALHIETWELLMPPARAYAIRKKLAEEPKPVKTESPSPSANKRRKTAVRT